MKREYLFFLVMVLAAAIITGATIGFTSHFHCIAVQLHENSATVEKVSEQTETSESKNAMVGNQAQDSKINKQVAGSYSANPVSQQGYMVLSRDEKEQVISMLESLGAKEGTDYSKFIRNFQQEKALTPTGNLDSLTLQAIIREVTKQRALEMVKG